MEQYYVYHNWRVERGGKARTHLGGCSFCNNGLGIHNTGPTRNGEWLGPFKTKQDALTRARNTGAARVDCCKKCSP